MQYFLISLIAVSVSAVAQDTPKIRVSITAQSDTSSNPKLISLLSREVRRLDSAVVTDSEPHLRVFCVVADTIASTGARDFKTGYAASLVVTNADKRVLAHAVRVDASLERLSRELAFIIDGTILESARRAAAGLPHPQSPRKGDKGTITATESDEKPEDILRTK